MSVYDDDYPLTNDPECMKWRALDALYGSAFQDGGMFVDAICQLLRSDADLSRDFRDELAGAIERGRSGYRTVELNNEGIPKPRLVAECFPAAKMRKAVNDRFRWFDAGQAVCEARQSGLSGDEAIIAAGSKFSLGYEAMRKYAIPYYKEFVRLFEKGDEWLNHNVAFAAVFPEISDDLQGEDQKDRDFATAEVYDIMKCHYIWATADMAVNGLTSPRSSDKWQW